MKKKPFIFIIFLFLFLTTGFAIPRPLYSFDTVEQAAQFQMLTKTLRCLVCQNQNLAESEAPLAKDLRQLIYLQIKQGQSNDEISGYLTARYGNFIRYHPPFNRETLLLWLTPILSLFLGFLLLCYKLKTRTPD
jgi:cytochrome c-type biogenesis protein CcmH